MKISTSTSDFLARFGHETAFRLYNEAGFDGIDYGMFHLAPDGDLFTRADDAEFAAYFRDVLRLAREYGLEVSQTHVPFPLKSYSERDPMLLACAIRSIYATAELESPYAVFHPGKHPSFIYGRNYEFCKSSNVEFFSALVPAIRETGVRVAIENLFAADPDTKKLIPSTCSKAEWMIDLIDTLNDMHGGELFVACLDTGHAALAGSGAADMLMQLGDRAKVLHVHDNDGYTDKHQIPGVGLLNFKEFMNAVRAVKFDGAFSFEAVNFYRQWSDPIYGLDVAGAAAKMLCAVGRALTAGLTAGI